MTQASNPFQPGDWADHISGQLDPREVAAVEGEMIRLRIGGVVTDLVPAANYARQAPATIHMTSTQQGLSSWIAFCRKEAGCPWSEGPFDTQAQARAAGDAHLAEANKS